MTQTVRKELLAQLQHLRTEAKEISRLYAANLQREIVELIEFLNENQNSTSGKSPRGASAVFSRMKDTIDEINVKPEKGRRKDLRKIEDAVRSMRRIAFSAKKET
jgi:hypothetical protein